ncbi:MULTISPECIES: fimbrial protein [Proteus]|uniref:fimbrial protein n=1 Tax=Proteus TaxID=583 RepID=UPI000197CF3A|nr:MULTISPECIES: fimbrial protein [Proteus]EEG83323.1 hypothetical protein PROPEN_04087 [Proteus penneri ATCC 35198]SUC00692.1 fimbrial subunit [Proteus penneri]
MNIFQQYCSRIVCLFISASFCYNALAVTTTLTIQGNILLPSPCVINGEQTISVIFDDALTTRIDGVNYRKPIDYTLECTAASNNAVKMMILGGDAGFNTGALQTSVVDLGISLEADGKVLPVNNWINFTLPHKPVLYAVPVKRPGGTLIGQTFDSSATMLIEYQ